MAAKKKPGFEQQLEKLEELVEGLENGDLALEEGVERYREGVDLLKSLNQTLADAEHKVEELTATLRAELKELEQNGDDLDLD
ncbi:MAG: exodeoxyribonuclease VII small subunit [Planctomycetota bacterium]|nr:exodeoxyribonuclease VII small subunit [Planctomycetota bacterium]MDA1114121.1 exodeoxyribonuclease VII small subunit [Planctomycetota bacterium]